MSKLTVLDFEPDSVVNGRILIAGKSGTGKTTIIKHLLNIIKDRVPRILIVSQTECSNGSFSSIVPQQLIIPTFSMSEESDTEKTTDFVKAQRHIKYIYNEQANKTARYNKTKNVDILKSIYDKITASGDTEISGDIGHIIRQRSLFQASTRRTDPENLEAKMKEYDATTYTTKMSDLLKKWLIANQPSDIGSVVKDLTSEELDVYRDLRINPKLVIVIDDCAALLKTYWKIPEFKNMFNNGRHVHLTMIVCAQSTTDSEKAMRNQCNIKIFTTGGSASQLIKSDHSEQQKELIPNVEKVFKARDTDKGLYYCFAMTDQDSGAFLAKYGLVFTYNPDLDRYLMKLAQEQTQTKKEPSVVKKLI